jgi:isocitrate dehydrogenase
VGPDVPVDFDKAKYQAIEMKQVLQALQLFDAAGIEVVKTENLYLFDGVRGFSLGQGE